MFFKSELFEIHTSSRNSVNIRNLYKVIIDDELKQFSCVDQIFDLLENSVVTMYIPFI